MGSRLAGKAVLIVGASSGIGEQLARELAGRGAKLGLVARRKDRLEALTDELRGQGAQAAWAAADVVDTDALWAALDSVSSEVGGDDVVVANAGYNRPESAKDFKPGRSEKIYDVNLLGALRTFDWALPRYLERRSGHLVGVASVASYYGFPANAAYCGSKAALRVHMQALRMTVKRRGVAVTTICPGFVVSELTEKNTHPMPFLWPTDRAARRIADAIEKRRGEVVFPWQMRFFVTFLLGKMIPRAVSERLIVRG